MLSWELFRHYLLSRRAGALIRTVAWLCMIGVGVGVLSLVVVISVMNGFNDSYKRRLLAVEPHLVVSVPGVSQVQALLEHPIYQGLHSNPEIQIDVFENQDVIIRTVDGVFGGGEARGIESKLLHSLLEETRKANTPKSRRGSTDIEVAPVLSETAHLEPGEVFMGIDLARSLGIFEGDRITVIAPEALLLPAGEAPPFERVMVKGLLTTNVADIDSKAIFYNRGKTFLAFRNSPSRSSGYEIRLPDASQFSGIKSELEAKGAEVTTWIDRNSALFYALRMEKISMGTFLALSALIASFSIVTVLVLLLTQKRKDIGVLMALGLSPVKTRNLFIRVGLLLSYIGIGGGLILGIVICVILERYPLQILPDIYYDTTIPAKIDPVFILGIFVMSSVIAFISAYIPARNATRELPAEALRSQRQIHVEPQ